MPIYFVTHWSRDHGDVAYAEGATDADACANLLAELQRRDLPGIRPFVTWQVRPLRGPLVRIDWGFAWARQGHDVEDGKLF